MLRRLRAALVAVSLTVGSLAAVMVPGPAEARSETCRTVDYGGYTDTPCYVASWTSPNQGAPAADCVVNDHTAGDYKVVIGNTAGPLVSDAATLTVSSGPGAPSITSHPQNQSGRGESESLALET